MMMNIMLICAITGCAVTFGLWCLNSSNRSLGIAKSPGLFEELRKDSDRISQEYEENKEYDRKRLEITFDRPHE